MDRDQQVDPRTSIDECKFHYQTVKLSLPMLVDFHMPSNGPFPHLSGDVDASLFAVVFSLCSSLATTHQQLFVEDVCMRIHSQRPPQLSSKAINPSLSKLAFLHVVTSVSDTINHNLVQETHLLQVSQAQYYFATDM